MLFSVDLPVADPALSKMVVTVLFYGFLIIMMARSTLSLAKALCVEHREVGFEWGCGAWFINFAAVSLGIFWIAFCLFEIVRAVL